jgi:hypothetical protein
MPHTSTDLNRRKLLKLGAAGVAFAGSGRVLAQIAGPETSSRPRPPQPIRLQSRLLELALDPADALPFSYTLIKSGIVFRGEDTGTPLKARVCRGEPWAFTDVDVRPSTHTGSVHSANFRFTANCSRQPVMLYRRRVS